MYTHIHIYKYMYIRTNIYPWRFGIEPCALVFVHIGFASYGLTMSVHAHFAHEARITHKLHALPCIERFPGTVRKEVG